MPELRGVLETALYVEDVACSHRFYQDVFGLETLVSEPAFGALRVAAQQVLLLFRKGSTSHRSFLPGGTIPPHDGAGRLHLAFAVNADELVSWEERLREHGVTVEGRVTWPRGGRSVYLRDPDGHLVELATPGIWAVY